jgi:hypothetical protein
MRKALPFALLFALAGCSALPQATATASACAAGEATYACQVERYHNVAAE